MDRYATTSYPLAPPHDRLAVLKSACADPYSLYQMQKMSSARFALAPERPTPAPVDPEPTPESPTKDFAGKYGYGVRSTGGTTFDRYVYPNGFSRPSLEAMDKIEAARKANVVESDVRVKDMREFANDEFKRNVAAENTAYETARDQETERTVCALDEERVYREKKVQEFHELQMTQAQHKAECRRNGYSYTQESEAYGGYAGYGASGQYSRARVAPCQSYGEIARSGVSCLMDCELATKGYYKPAQHN